jgi:hypothetical protein
MNRAAPLLPPPPASPVDVLFCLAPLPESGAWRALTDTTVRTVRPGKRS